MSMSTEVQALQQIAIERYEIDGGEMLETSSAADYEAAIAESGTAEAAWAFHMRILEARREAGGYYEVF